jgi:broad specificity phosphatase PhoE
MTSHPRTEEPQDTTLILVRHGETVWNRDKRWQGQTNSPLTDLGREQGARVAKRLSSLQVSAIYSSDLGRARETADLIAAPHGLPVVPREDLRERAYGLLEGKTDDEAARLGPSWLLAFQADRIRSTPPGGEIHAELCERVVEALSEIADAHPGQTVVVATHGGPIKCALYHILSIPLSLWRLTWIANGSITIFRGTRDVLRVAYFNDTCHLEAPALAPTEMED